MILILNSSTTDLALVQVIILQVRVETRLMGICSCRIWEMVTIIMQAHLSLMVNNIRLMVLEVKPLISRLVHQFKLPSYQVCHFAMKNCPYHIRHLYLQIWKKRSFSQILLKSPRQKIVRSLLHQQRKSQRNRENPDKKRIKLLKQMLVQHAKLKRKLKMICHPVLRQFMSPPKY